jgi:lipid-binding SYLF domain-containing protein
MRIGAGRWLVVLAAALCSGGCESTYRQDTRASATLTDQVQETIRQFRQRDPGIGRFLDAAHAYVVFPEVGKGAVGLGGAHGTGEVYEQGSFIGRATMTQVTAGFALGGQVYGEIIFFQTRTSLDIFRSDRLEFSGNASAVVATAGAAAAADYENGVAVFVMPRAGFMFEASIGGQKFHFIPKPS